MQSRDVVVPTLLGPGLLRAPDQGAPVRGGVVALHGAALPQREQPLFEHLARILTPFGFAVLTYDRRAALDSGDTPLDIQAEDALAAVAVLAAETGAPVGVFGFSQGAWAAALAASRSRDVKLLALVGCCGVSPAVQMRYYTDELLRRAGYGVGARAQLRAVRLAVEEVLRGTGNREQAARLLAAAAIEPWFAHAYLRPELPTPGEGWPDMDYDPEATFSAVTCPTLLMYGADEECVPAGASKAVWLRASRAAGNSDLTIVDLPGCGHFPAADHASADLQFSVADVSPAYTTALQSWFADREVEVVR
jgi:pimeloyl-ACP methyl ester carboxylesterase